jgi:hypothetical protein
LKAALEDLAKVDEKKKRDLENLKKVNEVNEAYVILTDYQSSLP